MIQDIYPVMLISVGKYSICGYHDVYMPNYPKTWKLSIIMSNQGSALSIRCFPTVARASLTRLNPSPKLSAGG